MIGERREKRVSVWDRRERACARPCAQPRLKFPGSPAECMWLLSAPRAVGQTVTLLHPSVPSVGVSIGIRNRGCQ